MTIVIGVYYQGNLLNNTIVKLDTVSINNYFHFIGDLPPQPEWKGELSLKITFNYF